MSRTRDFRVFERAAGILAEEEIRQVPGILRRAAARSGWSILLILLPYLYEILLLILSRRGQEDPMGSDRTLSMVESGARDARPRSLDAFDRADREEPR